MAAAALGLLMFSSAGLLQWIFISVAVLGLADWLHHRRTRSGWLLFGLVALGAGALAYRYSVPALPQPLLWLSAGLWPAIAVMLRALPPARAPKLLADAMVLVGLASFALGAWGIIGAPVSQAIPGFVHPNAALLLFVLAIGAATDVGGYFAGRNWGERPLPLLGELSPNKTLEGLLGGLAFSGALSLAAAVLLDSWHLLWIGALVLPWFAVVGDLLFSWIKRVHHLKDAGSWALGHGGIADRIDSHAASLAGGALLLHLLGVAA